MRPGFWRRNSWKFLLALVVVIGLFGVGDAIVGVDADPAIPVAITGLTPDEIRVASDPVHRLIDLQVRAGGLQLIVISILWAVLILVPLRRGEKWAWYTLWTFPIWGLAVSVAFLFVELQPDQPPPPPAISGWVFFASTSALLWAARSRGDAFPPQDVAKAMVQR
ncbi:MAG TPA: hypothetical protein VLB67_05275 [Acidimicrobiia bacterium]|nr:hypothetical protein [Acidimicrobiia bacterium]